MKIQPGQTCPAWQYTDTHGWNAILTDRAKAAVMGLRSDDHHATLPSIRDTRPIHGHYFSGLTPVGFDHYAGHYRGEKLACLEIYEVMVHGDDRVGHAAVTVPMEIADFAGRISEVVSQLDLLWSLSSAIIGKAVKLQRTVQLAAALLVDFLEIHPYADGNGHMGRFLLLGIFARYGLYPARFPLHPRPDRPYADLIPLYRNGDKRQLELYIMKAF
jgi:hypothetical protein